MDRDESDLSFELRIFVVDVVDAASDRVAAGLVLRVTAMTEGSFLSGF
jgi:hypothetical protein